MEKNSDTNIFAENKDEIKEMVQLFIRCGLIEDEAIAEEKIRKAKRNKNKRVYHNTKLMLEQYRKLAWVVKSFPDEISMELNEEFEEMISEIRNAVEILDEAIDTVSLETILNRIGFPDNWYEIRMEDVR